MGSSKPMVPVALALAVTACAAIPGAAGAEEVVAEVRVAFTGSSTLHDFGGDAPAVTIPVVRAEDGTWAAVVVIPVATLDTDNARRDGKMREMLRAGAHPAIRGTLRGIVPDEVRDGGRLPLMLEIGGVSRPATASIADWTAAPDGNAVSFTATFVVSLARFDLEAPTALLVVRVADTVHVRAEVQVRREPPPSGS